MSVATNHPKNQCVLDYLRRLSRDRPIGLHPDIRERTLELRRALQEVVEIEFRGGSLVVSKWTGVVVIAGFGTVYCLRAGASIHDALQNGLRTSMKFSNGEYLDVSVQLGTDWVFGMWNPQEIKWLQAVLDKENDE